MLFTQFDRPPEDNFLLYVMDPMCSWCHAFAPVISALKAGLEKSLPVYTLLGGLAPDTDEPMPELQRRQIEQIWHQIESRTGTRFNYRFWTENTPRRSTWPACRAVVAAGCLQSDRSDQMIAAIQRAYYLEARNPSDDKVLIELATELGIDGQGFETLLTDSTTAQLFEQQLHFKDRLGIQGFPSLLLYRADQYSMISHGYCDQQTLAGRCRGLGLEI